MQRFSILFLLLAACQGTGLTGSNQDAGSDAGLDASRDAGPNCGDGVLDPDEDCDGANLGGFDCAVLGFESGTLGCNACLFDTSQCTGIIPVCGDGIVDEDEDCDGANLDLKDCADLGFDSGVLGCDACVFDTSQCEYSEPVCGNGVIEEGENCDDGNQNLTDSCPDGPGGSCEPAFCGDGFVRAGHEECDDGNGSNQDDCPDGVGGTCEWYYCGDGFVHGLYETCDTMDATCWDCDTFCGDGRVDTAYEICDPAYLGICSDDCSSGCGDGIVDPSLGEECDEGSSQYLTNGNRGEGPGCRRDCTATTCGDGLCEYQNGAELPSFCPQDCGCDPATNNGCAPGSACIIDHALMRGQCVVGGENCGGIQCGLDEVCLTQSNTCVVPCDTTASNPCPPMHNCVSFSPAVWIAGTQYGRCASWI